MNHPHHNLDASLGYHAVITNRLISRRLNRRFLEAGLDVTPEQWAVLVHLWEYPALSQEEMAGILCMEKSSLSRVLDVLERKGYVRRARDPRDARRKRVLPTDKADGIRETCRVEAWANLAQVTRDIAPNDLETCLRVLRHVQRNIQEDI